MNKKVIKDRIRVVRKTNCELYSNRECEGRIYCIEEKLIDVEYLDDGKHTPTEGKTIMIDGLEWYII